MFHIYIYIYIYDISSLRVKNVWKCIYTPSFDTARSLVATATPCCTAHALRLWTNSLFSLSHSFVETESKDVAILLWAVNLAVHHTVEQLFEWRSAVEIADGAKFTGQIQQPA